MSHEAQEKNPAVKNTMKNFLANLENSWLGIVDLSQNKQDLQKYKNFKFMKEVVRNLTDFSLYLKKHPQKDKVPLTQTLVKKVNNVLIERRKTLAQSEACNEMLIPFQLEGASACSLVVVGILVDEILCFETHKRVPYRVVFECVEWANQR